MNIDRDAYQAQIAIEQLASAPEEEVAGLFESYEGNRDQTRSRWLDYQAVARGLGDEESRWLAYDAARDAWVAATDALAARMVEEGERLPSEALVADLIASRALVDGVRDVLDGIVEEIYVPNQATFRETVDRRSRREPASRMDCDRHRCGGAVDRTDRGSSARPSGQTSGRSRRPHRRR